MGWGARIPTQKMPMGRWRVAERPGSGSEAPGCQRNLQNFSQKSMENSYFHRIFQNFNTVSCANFTPRIELNKNLNIIVVRVGGEIFLFSLFLQLVHLIFPQNAGAASPVPLCGKIAV